MRVAMRLRSRAVGIGISLASIMIMGGCLPPELFLGYTDSRTRDGSGSDGNEGDPAGSQPDGSGGSAEQRYSLAVRTDGDGSVALDPPGGTYQAGTKVTLSASSGEGHEFVSWRGDVTGTKNPATIVMSGNKTVTAVFTEVKEMATVSASWKNSSSGRTYLWIEWRLPSGEMRSITDSGDGPSGALSSSMLAEDLPDGMHWLTLGMSYRGYRVYTDVTYEVHFPEYDFAVTRRISSGAEIGVAVVVKDGVARVVHNGWLEADQPGAGAPTCWYPLEFQAGWRGGQHDVHLSLELTLPNGEIVRGFSSGHEYAGFSRVAISDLACIEDGTYDLSLELSYRGYKSFSDVTCQVYFLGYEFAQTDRLSCPLTHRIQLQVTDGVVRELANSW